jgi:SAM-dependent methyltransferase
VTLRRGVADVLERAHLEGPAYRLMEWGLTVPALPEMILPSRRQGSDGLPLPPPLLRVQVMGSSNPEAFLAQGRRAAQIIADVVGRSGRPMEELEAVLDFGCGSGRVMRRWVDLAGPQLFGSDYNPQLVSWCKANLPFASFEVNKLEPPLPFEDEQFDLVYALSVFTHLDESLQHDWIAELHRVLRPGGLLVFSTRGEALSWKLDEGERAQYDAGELVVRYRAVEGTNLCAAFHPWPYVHDNLLASFKLLESRRGGLVDGAQDLHSAERLR